MPSIEISRDQKEQIVTLLNNQRLQNKVKFVRIYNYIDDLSMLDGEPISIVEEFSASAASRIFEGTEDFQTLKVEKVFKSGYTLYCSNAHVPILEQSGIVKFEE